MSHSPYTVIRKAVAALGWLLPVLCLFLMPIAAEETAAEADPAPKVINVMDYGAMGDGVTDDTLAINVAAALLGDGDTLYFPEGTYLLKEYGSGTIVYFEKKKNITVRMEEETVLQMDTVADGSTGELSPHYMLHFYCCENVTIMGGNITGDRLRYTGGTTNRDGIGVRLTNCKDVTVRDVEISYLRGDGISALSGGVHADGQYGVCRNVTVEDCVIHDCQRSGVSMKSVDGFVLRNTNISNVRGVLPQAGVYVYAEFKEIFNSDILVEDCYIHDNGHASFYATREARDIIIRNNVLLNRVDFGADVRNVRISDCELNRVGNHGTEVLVENCTLKSACLFAGQITYTDCVFDGRDPFTYRVLVANKNKTAEAVFENCTFRGRGTSTLLGGLVICLESPTSLEFSDCDFKSCGMIPFVGLLGNVEREGCFFGLGWALWLCIVAFLALVGFLVYRRVRKRRIAARK